MLKILKVKSEMLFRKLGNKFGVDVKMTDEERFMLLLKHHKVNIIFDVGANTGQYAATLFSLGYKGKIISFEPLSDAHAALVKKSSSNPDWSAAPRCALGDYDGEIDINVSENSVSSSILPVLNEHVKAEPKSRTIRTEKTPLFKLDTIASQYYNKSDRILLKIDTQGFEDVILKGAEETLKKVKGVQLELSLVKLYEGQKLFIEMIQKMESMGFRLELLEPSFTDKATGKVLQMDGVFFKD